MTRPTTLMSTVAALAAVTALAAPASAMTCIDFVNMSADERMAAVEDMDAGGRMAARDAANNADGATDDDAGVTVSSDDDATAGGRENARDYARGEDVVVAILEDCARSSESDLDSLIDATQ